MPPNLFFLPLLHLLISAHALIISAPEACGGTHVVTHASAFFGPRPGASNVRDVPLFAAAAQKDGHYLPVRVRLPAPSRPAAHPPAPPAPTPTRSLRGLFSAFAALLSASRPVSPAETQARVSEVENDVKPSFVDEDDVHSLVARPVSREQPIAATSGSYYTGSMSAPLVRDNEAAHAQSVMSGDAVRGEDVNGLRGHDEDNAEMSQQSTARQSTAPFSLFNACCQLSVPADLLAVKGRVAVVARGVCDFAQKVGFMQAAGAVGVIVVNAKDGEDKLANMKLNETKKETEQITIPAVMISYKDWASILPCRNDTKVVFTAEGEATFDIDYGRDALNWAMMRGMALWILCQCGVNVVRYKRRVSEFRARADAIAALPVDTYSRPQHPVREESAATETDARPKAVQNSTVARPVRSSPILDHAPERVGLISAAVIDTEVGAGAASSASTAVEGEVERIEERGEEQDEEPVCAICLEDFETGQQVRLLACSHLYHRTCIDPWLQSSSNSCPLCKREVPNLPPPPTQAHYGSMIVQ